MSLILKKLYFLNFYTIPACKICQLKNISCNPIITAKRRSVSLKRMSYAYLIIIRQDICQIRNVNCKILQGREIR